MTGVSFQALIASGGKLSSLSFVTSANVNAGVSTSDTITAPAGIQAGDLIVLYDTRNAVITPAAPSGFSIAVSTSSGITAVISYKISAGTESGTTITGMTGTSVTYNMLLAVFRGNQLIKAVTVGSANQQNTAGAPTNQSCTASGGLPPLIIVASYHNDSTGTAISPRGFSPAADGEITSNTHNFLDYKIYNVSPADTTISMADFGTNNTLQSCYLACA
jgi:hypothetical protein